MKKSIQQSNDIRQPNAGSRKPFGKSILFFLMAFAMAFSLQSCDLEFLLGEGEETETGNNGTKTETGAAKGAVKYDLSTGGQMALTFDGSKNLYRSDSWNSGIHTISITDTKNKTVDMYNSYTWTSMTYTDPQSGSAPNTSDAAKVENLPDKTIAGKTCKAYKVTPKTGSQYIYAIWQGLTMYYEDLSSGVKMTATSATLTVPANAFSKETIEVTWL